MFNKKTFLITGASGFIGGRIIERLCRDYDCHIKALVHKINHATRIARFDIEIICGDILDKKLLEKITKNVDYVIHCAVGNTADTGLNHQITVQGTRNIVQASFKNKVKRLIYFSTMSVYGYPLPSVVNEETPYKKVSGDFYNNDKIEAEEIVQNYIKKGLPVVILQPTIVYGPYAPVWTIGPISQVKNNSVFLVDRGQGIANPVYIDNVVDAVFLALTKKEATGEKFIISEGKGITWEKFYRAYQKMIGKENFSHLTTFNKLKLEIVNLPIEIARRMRAIFDPFEFFRIRPAFIDKTILPLYRRTKAVENLSADKNRQLFFKDKCFFEIKKAKKILGYSPRISFVEGMRLTEKWLKYARII